MYLTLNFLYFESQIHCSKNQIFHIQKGLSWRLPFCSQLLSACCVQSSFPIPCLIWPSWHSRCYKGIDSGFRAQLAHCESGVWTSECERLIDLHPMKVSGPSSLWAQLLPRSARLLVKHFPKKRFWTSSWVLGLWENSLSELKGTSELM